MKMISWSSIHEYNGQLVVTDDQWDVIRKDIELECKVLQLRGFHPSNPSITAKLYLFTDKLVTLNVLEYSNE